MTPVLSFRDVSKTFTMHLQGGVRLPVVERVSFDVGAGECVVLGGPSGAGKSSVLKMAYGNYAADGGAILVRHGAEETDIATADARTVLDLRARTLAYVSQFLRVVPRVSALDVVAEAAGEARAKELLARLNLPERLWGLPPATFSGGEQQRVNIARGLASAHPILLLDEPTASLDARNREVVIEMIAARIREGAAVLAIFHDERVRDALADRIVDVTAFAPRAAA